MKCSYIFGSNYQGWCTQKDRCRVPTRPEHRNTHRENWGNVYLGSPLFEKVIIWDFLDESSPQKEKEKAYRRWANPWVIETTVIDELGNIDELDLISRYQLPQEIEIKQIDTNHEYEKSGIQDEEEEKF